MIPGALCVCFWKWIISDAYTSTQFYCLSGCKCLLRRGITLFQQREFIDTGVCTHGRALISQNEISATFEYSNFGFPDKLTVISLSLKAVFNSRIQKSGIHFHDKHFRFKYFNKRSSEANTIERWMRRIYNRKHTNMLKNHIFLSRLLSESLSYFHTVNTWYTHITHTRSA